MFDLSSTTLFYKCLILLLAQRKLLKILRIDHTQSKRSNQLDLNLYTLLLISKISYDIFSCLMSFITHHFFFLFLLFFNKNRSFNLMKFKTIGHYKEDDVDVYLKDFLKRNINWYSQILLVINKKSKQVNNIVNNTSIIQTNKLRVVMECNAELKKRNKGI